ncbi:MAG: class I SAM-dependent methyltransferase [Acidimicrobiales bacterium]|nr:class I SAM-dependent methyltransferase [Acidimicrobiales bacterium]
MSTDTTSTDTSTDFATVKQRQQSSWSAGDYARIGVTLQIVGERLAESVEVVAGSRVLDAAAGNGNAALAAARRGCQVTAVDYVPELLDHLRQRAAADQLDVETRVEDIESLPLDDGSFDSVLSTFGVAFTPDHERAAAELTRLCRPGGRIGLANWTPDSFVAAMLRTIGGYVAPPAGVRSPIEWGTEAHLQELFANSLQDLETVERTFVFRYRSPEHFVDVFRTLYGPMVKAFESLDTDGAAALTSDLIALCEASDTSDERGGLRIPSPYLEAVLTTSA